MVCGRVLDYAEGLGYIHSVTSLDEAEWDHPPIPVSYEDAGEQLRGRCDFCFADFPTFVLPARDFIHQGGGLKGDWAACENCAHLIEANKWNQLLERFRASYAAQRDPLPPAQLDAVCREAAGLWRVLRKNLSGAVRPL